MRRLFSLNITTISVFETEDDKILSDAFRVCVCLCACLCVCVCDEVDNSIGWYGTIGINKKYMTLVVSYNRFDEDNVDDVDDDYYDDDQTTRNTIL